MRNRIEGFENGQLDLGRLINDLHSLIAALEHPTDDWKQRFLADWWTLEQVYAVAIDRNELDRLPKQNQGLLLQAVAALKQLVLEAISSASRSSAESTS
jgi:predicted RNA-binding protein with EMAP domain